MKFGRKYVRNYVGNLFQQYKININTKICINIMEKLKFRKLEEPLLKWIGGKRKLLDNILPKFPEKIRK